MVYECNTGSAPLFTSGPLLNQGALTVRVGMPPSPRPLLSPNDTYVLRVIGVDLSVDSQERLSSILYLSQRPDAVYESNLLSLDDVGDGVFEAIFQVGND